MVETGKRFYGDLRVIEEFAKSLRDLGVQEVDIMARIGEETYHAIYNDEKKPKRSLAEEIKIAAEGANHDPLYFDHAITLTPSGLRYDRDMTMQIIRHMRAKEASDHEIEEVIGHELFELLGKKKEKKEKKDDNAKKPSRFAWLRK